MEMTLLNAQEGVAYTVRRIDCDDKEMTSFLFSLGCYSGEPITVIARKHSSCIVSIKDARYCIDNHLAQAIVV